MKLATIYKRAAEHRSQSDRGGCCHSLSRVCFFDRADSELSVFDSDLYRQAEELFIEYFKPRRLTTIHFWWEQDELDARVIALLLMHHIAKDQGL